MVYGFYNTSISHPPRSAVHMCVCHVSSPTPCSACLMVWGCGTGGEVLRGWWHHPRERTGGPPVRHWHHQPGAGAVWYRTGIPSPPPPLLFLTSLIALPVLFVLPLIHTCIYLCVFLKGLFLGGWGWQIEKRLERLKKGRSKDPQMKAKVKSLALELEYKYLSAFLKTDFVCIRLSQTISCGAKVHPICMLI